MYNLHPTTFPNIYSWKKRPKITSQEPKTRDVKLFFQIHM